MTTITSVRDAIPGDLASNILPNAALKHHTSKLASFEDLGTVVTFGFRGEALSSLCALSSSVAVTTATTAQAPMGTILEFERSGKVKDRSGKTARKVCPTISSCSRAAHDSEVSKRGTTVMITGLFTPLPVRRKEFERNAKREYGKALTMLHAYALVPCTKANKGVRLTVSNHPDKG
jgi:DNA mismatch repair protein PMS2